MAVPYTEDGGHQGVPFLQHQFPGLYFGGSVGDSADSFTPQQSILDQNDNAYLTSFFTDPNNVEKTTAAIPFQWPELNQKVTGGSIGGQMDGFESTTQTIHNPAVTLGDSSSHYPANTHSHPVQMASHMDFGDEHPQGSEDDFKAASGLLGMSLHGQESSRGLAHPENAMMTQWPDYSGIHNVHMQDNITSPMTSSGRQSANSYHSHTPTGYMNSQLQGGVSQQQLMQHFELLQHNQLRMAQNMPRARHNSLQLETNPFNYMPSNAQQVQMAHSANPYIQGRPRPGPPVRFGSDQDFRHSGYYGPNSNISIEQEKEGNLINVPLAAQAAAANGQGHVHQHGPHMTQQLQYSQFPVTGGSRPFQAMSAASSPGHMGGLPFKSPSFNAHVHTQPFKPTAQQPVGEDDSESEDEEPEFYESQPRKRRKSQMDRTADAEYNPSGHVKVSMAKRDAKPYKAVAMEESDDEYQTPAKVMSGKRRKSSIAGTRPSLNSSNSTSPSANPSPAGNKVPASGKKKGRDTEPRKNLTEDQKRKNHIASEKQRRDLIKVQYDALDSLVPGLKGGKSGLSRSDVLQEIVTYVESIISGNAEMERMLTEMGEMEIADAPIVDGDEDV